MPRGKFGPRCTVEVQLGLPRVVCTTAKRDVLDARFATTGPRPAVMEFEERAFAATLSIRRQERALRVSLALGQVNHNTHNRNFIGPAKRKGLKGK